MDVPLEIAFHNVESSKPAEDEIRARVADLERVYGRLISCRVRVEQRAVNPSNTIPPVVHIERSDERSCFGSPFGISARISVGETPSIVTRSDSTVDHSRSSVWVTIATASSGRAQGDGPTFQVWQLA